MINVSVIVPFLNAERYLENCIDGLLSQSYPVDQYEIIMVDNNSTDASAEIVKRYPRVSLLSEAKQGAYAARNRGLRESRGRIVAFTDADCVPAGDWLQEIVTALAQPDARIVLGHWQFARDSRLLSMLAAYEHEKHDLIFNSESKELYYGYTNNMAVKKEVFDEIGFFTERRRGGDTIFLRQALDKYSCEAVCYNSRIKVRHLEIDGLSKFYRKYFTYGLSSQRYGRIVKIRALASRERALVFYRVVQNQGYSQMKSAILLLLLILGVVCWWLGNISAPLVDRFGRGKNGADQ